MWGRDFYFVQSRGYVCWLGWMNEVLTSTLIIDLCEYYYEMKNGLDSRQYLSLTLRKQFIVKLCSSVGK